jgi:hypothetical protein
VGNTPIHLHILGFRSYILNFLAWKSWNGYPLYNSKARTLHAAISLYISPVVGWNKYMQLCKILYVTVLLEESIVYSRPIEISVVISGCRSSQPTAVCQLFANQVRCITSSNKETSCKLTSVNLNDRRQLSAAFCVPQFQPHMALAKSAVLWSSWRRVRMCVRACMCMNECHKMDVDNLRVHVLQVYTPVSNYPKPPRSPLKVIMWPRKWGQNKNANQLQNAVSQTFISVFRKKNRITIELYPDCWLVSQFPWPPFQPGQRQTWVSQHISDVYAGI